MVQPPDVSVRLFQNPWKQMLPNEVLITVLTTAATEASERLAQMIDVGEVSPMRDSFGCVILDPTHQRWQQTPVQRTLAAVLIGPDAERFLPNALAKADAHDRHGLPNSGFFGNALFCLGDGDFTYGHSAEYDVVNPRDGLLVEGVAIAGGSGLSEDQDHELALMILSEAMGTVHDYISTWRDQQRAIGRGRWFNESDVPPKSYTDILTAEAIEPISL
jgi:hypothetical protein